MPSVPRHQESGSPVTRLAVEMVDMSTLRQRLALVPPTDAQLLADGREHARRVLSEAQPPVEDIRNALVMLALAVSGTTPAGEDILGFSLENTEAIERLLRASVVKLDAINGGQAASEERVSGFVVQMYDAVDTAAKRRDEIPYTSLTDAEFHALAPEERARRKREYERANEDVTTRLWGLMGALQQAIANSRAAGVR